MTVVIVNAAPFDDRRSWGDHYLARELAVALSRRGHHTVVRYRDSTGVTGPVDVQIVLRGAVPVEPRPGAINVLWIICDPEQVEPEELDGFDLVCPASESWSTLLRTVLHRPILALPQASGFTPPGPSDTARVPVELLSQVSGRVLFVGNSRGESRPVVALAAEGGLDPVVIGEGWDNTEIEPLVIQQRVENALLPVLYAAARLVLNDHWPSMVDFDIVSNRLFDITAAGGRAVTDPVDAIGRLLPQVTQVHDADGLAAAAQAGDNGHDNSHGGREHTSVNNQPIDPSIDERVDRMLEAVVGLVGEVPPIQRAEPASIRVVVAGRGVTDPTTPAHHRAFRSVVSPLAVGAAPGPVSIVMADLADPAIAEDGANPGTTVVVICVATENDLADLGRQSGWPSVPYAIQVASSVADAELLSALDAAVASWGPPLVVWGPDGIVEIGPTGGRAVEGGEHTPQAFFDVIDPRLWRRYDRASVRPPELNLSTPRCLHLADHLTPTTTSVDHYRAARNLRRSGPYDLVFCGADTSTASDRSDRRYEMLVGRALGAMVVATPEVAALAPVDLGRHLVIRDHTSLNGIESLDVGSPDVDGNATVGRFPNERFWAVHGHRQAGASLWAAIKPQLDMQPLEAGV